MTYTPNTWATGDTITAAKLNNMESGISNASLIVPIFSGEVDEVITCDLPYSTVETAALGGKCIYALLNGEMFQFYSVTEDISVEFANVYIDSASASMSWVTYNSDGTIEYRYDEYQPI